MVGVCAERRCSTAYRLRLTLPSPCAEGEGCVDAGELGDLIGLVGGNRGRPPLPPQYPAWITAPEPAGGGALIDHSVHVTDAMRFISGLEVPESRPRSARSSGIAGSTTGPRLLVFEGGAVGKRGPELVGPGRQPVGLRLLSPPCRLRRLVRPQRSRRVSPDRQPQMGRRIRLAGFADDVDLAMIEAFAASVVAGDGWHLARAARTGSGPSKSRWQDTSRRNSVSRSTSSVDRHVGGRRSADRLHVVATRGESRPT